MKFAYLTVILVILSATFLFGANEEKWFDMENCDMCKPLLENSELMKNMTWEHHKVNNGLISVTRVEPSFLDAYRDAHKKMENVSERWRKGEPVQLCNMCRGLGKIYKSGAVWETVESDNVIIGLTSSSDPEVIRTIHAWTDRTNKEILSMRQGENTEHYH